MEQRARIFLMAGRESTESETHRSQIIFSGESAKLQLITDESLAANSHRDYETADALVVIFPVIGAVEISSGSETELVATGSYLALPANESYRIINPYEKLQVNFLRILISGDGNVNKNIGSISNHRNQLQHMGTFSNVVLSVGIFDSRTKYELQSGPKTLALCLNGAFEFQDRLLETRDALWLEGFSLLDFESLSNDAILLLFAIED